MSDGKSIVYNQYNETTQNNYKRIFNGKNSLIPIEVYTCGPGGLDINGNPANRTAVGNATAILTELANLIEIGANAEYQNSSSPLGAYQLFLKDVPDNATDCQVISIKTASDENITANISSVFDILINKLTTTKVAKIFADYNVINVDVNYYMNSYVKSLTIMVNYNSLNYNVCDTEQLKNLLTAFFDDAITASASNHSHNFTRSVSVHHKLESNGFSI